MQGYLSRAAYKLLQLDDKHGVLPRSHGSTVLDLGCFPGAWLQVACQRLGPREREGRVVGIDLKAMERPATLCDDRVMVRRCRCCRRRRRCCLRCSCKSFLTIAASIDSSPDRNLIGSHVANRHAASRVRAASLVGVLQVYQADATSLLPPDLRPFAPFNAVLSDMCHDTSGSDVADVGRSLALCECVSANPFTPPRSRPL